MQSGAAAGVQVARLCAAGDHRPAGERRLSEDQQRRCAVRRPHPQGSLLYIDKYLSTPLFLLYAETTRLFIRGDSNNRLSFVYFKEKSFVTSGKLVCPFHFNRDHTVFAFHHATKPSRPAA